MKRISNEQIILALMGSDTKREAAEMLGCDPHVISNRLKDPTFQNEYGEYKRNILQGTANKLISSNTAAVDTLTQLLNSEIDMVRLNSAKAILSQSKEYMMLCDLQERILVLEEAIQDTDNSTNTHESR